MKIGPKLIGSFSIVALICGLVGGVGWYGINLQFLSRFSGRTVWIVQA